MSGSGHASAASAGLAAQSYSDSDNKLNLVRNEESDAGIEFGGYEEPVTKSHSEGKRKLDAEIPSTSQGKPRSEKILSEIKSDIESDDLESDEHFFSQRRWISDTEWLSYMKGDRHVRVTLSILRVPNFLKDTKMEAYVLQTVSLGPYHHKSEELAPMDDHKGRALRRMMIRSNNRMNLPPDNTDFANNATKKILSVLDKIRDIYEESIQSLWREPGSDAMFGRLLHYRSIENSEWVPV